jgi:hypothetical protein
MEINGLPPPSLLKSLTPLVDSWRVGQTLQATVVRPLSPHIVLLQINQQIFPAETPINLTSGQPLELLVTQLIPKPTLTILLPHAEEPVAQSALREALPRQTGMAPLLSNLNWIATQQSEQARSFPPPVVAAARELLNKLANSDQITQSNVLKAAIANSGLLLEHKLVDPQRRENPDEFNRDLKTLLLRLLSVTTQSQPRSIQQPDMPTSPNVTMTTSPSPLLSVASAALPPPQHLTPKAEPAAEATLQQLSNLLQAMHELGRQTEGSLARIQLQQLNSLPQPDQSTLLWSFDLPIRHQGHVDIFQFFVEGEASSEKKQHRKKRWAVTVAFDLKELGPAYARLGMEDEAVSATFWAERQETTTLIHQHLDELGQRFRRAGIEPNALQCFCGSPPALKTRPTTTSLDISV